MQTYMHVYVGKRSVMQHPDWPNAELTNNTVAAVVVHAVVITLPASLLSRILTGCREMICALHARNMPIAQTLQSDSTN